MVNHGMTTYEKEGLSPELLGVIKEYAKSIKNYIRPNLDYVGYRKQFSERIARVEGLKCKQSYIELQSKINEEFPYKHFEQFYPSANEGLENAYDDLVKFLIDMKDLM